MLTTSNGSSRRAILRAVATVAGLPLISVLAAACQGATTATPTAIGRQSQVSTVSRQATTAAASGTTGTATTAPQPAAAAVGGLSGPVDFWHVYNPSTAIPKLVALLQQKYPQLKVNFVPYGAAALATKLVAAAAGGTPPGGFYITAPFFHDTARFLAPLNAYINRDAKAIGVDDFLPIGLKANTINGKVYGLPMEIAVRIWWFNRQTLAEHGVALPVGPSAPANVTERQLEDMAQKLTSDKLYGLFVDRTWWDILIYVFGFGGKFLDDAQTKCLLDSPQAITGIQHAFDLVVQNKFGPATGGVVPHATSNDIAMALGNAALAQNFRPLSNAADWDSGPVVMGPAAPMSYAFVHAGGVVQGTKNPEAAWTVLSEYTGKDAEPFWMTAHGWPTVRQSYLNLWIKDGSAPPTTRQNVLEWAKVAPLITFPIGYNGSIGPVLTKAMSDAIAGKITVQDAATQAAQQVTALLVKS
jgi:multiple sugar transport system substrate-binding protein